MKQKIVGMKTEYGDGREGIDDSKTEKDYRIEN